ncbi:MAG: thiol-disulfide oxidoreductase DCC family protein [Mariniblastus sp.]
MVENKSIDKLITVPQGDLPSPLTAPKADLVIYDGTCNFCSSQVRNLSRFDGKNRLAFVSLHDPFVTEQITDLTHQQLMEQIFLIPNRDGEYSDRRLGGAAAIKYLTLRLPKLWILAPLFHVPFTGSLQQWAYRQIAKRRYKIAGKKEDPCDDQGTCDLHFRD